MSELPKGVAVVSPSDKKNALSPSVSDPGVYRPATPTARDSDRYRLVTTDDLNPGSSVSDAAMKKMMEGDRQVINVADGRQVLDVADSNGRPVADAADKLAADRRGALEIVTLQLKKIEKECELEKIVSDRADKQRVENELSLLRRKEDREENKSAIINNQE